MPAAHKIVESGLHPSPPPSLESKVLEHVDDICTAFLGAVRESLIRIKEAERHAIARLNEYVPTEPLMDSKQAAAYLKLPLRSLHLMTSPTNPEIPFLWIGGLKRFRKTSVDAWLDDQEVKKSRVKL